MKRYDKPEEFLLDFGTSFPRNPRNGQLFRRTDLGNTQFQYDAPTETWKALQFDQKINVPAPTTNKLEEKPVPRGEIKALADQQSGSTSPSQQFLKANSKPLYNLGGGTYINPDKVLTTPPIPEKDDFLDGAYKPLEGDDTNIPAAVASSRKAEFDSEGRFINTSPCPSVKVAIVGTLAEGTVVPPSPLRNCACVVEGMCPTVSYFNVFTRAEDATVPINAYKLVWRPPSINRDIIWAYHIEAVQYPEKNFATIDDPLWSGTVTFNRERPNKVFAVSGPALADYAVSGKAMYLYNTDSDCQKIFSINTQRTSYGSTWFQLNEPVSKDVWGTTVAAYVVEPPWIDTPTDGLDWYYDFKFVDDVGNPIADKYANEYTYMLYTPGDDPDKWDDLKFRICAYTWWSQGGWTYPESGTHKNKWKAPDAPTFVEVNPIPLGFIIEVTGSAGNYDIDGYELAFLEGTKEETPKEDPAEGSTSDWSYMQSDIGWFNISVDSVTTHILCARSYVGNRYSDWTATTGMPLFVTDKSGAAPTVHTHTITEIEGGVAMIIALGG